MAKSFQRFTLHVQLQHIEPPIWRRIEVEGTESLRKLHHILQAAFGWEDTGMVEGTMAVRAPQAVVSTNQTCAS